MESTKGQVRRCGGSKKIIRTRAGAMLSIKYEASANDVQVIGQSRTGDLKLTV